MQKTSAGHRTRLTVTTLVLVLILITLIGLIGSQKVSAAATTFSFGVGRGYGLEIGINLDALNQIRAEINNGLYNRACAPEEHDPTRWHTLVNVEKKCHYDHQHNDDPNYVNDVFGEPGAWFGRPGQSISYPWQTFPAKTMTESNEQYVAERRMENDLKHEGYTWIVRRDQQCPKGFCITDYRLLTHVIMGAHDMPVRFHSYSFEARVCADAARPETCGIVRTGSWVDTGKLMTTPPDVAQCGFGVGMIRVPIAADSQFYPIDEQSPDEIRCHPNIVSRLPAYPSAKPIAEWWAHNPGDRGRFQLRSYDPIGNLNVSEPGKWHYYCAQSDVNCKYDQTITTAWIGYVLKLRGECFPDGKCVDIDRDRNGYTDLAAFTDRWGTISRTCTQPGLDCIPLEYNHAPLHPDLRPFGESAFVHTICDTCPKTDYDLSPTGQKWNTWFYRYADHSGHTTPTATPVQPTSPPPTATQPNNPPATPSPTVNPNEPTVRVDVNPATANTGAAVQVVVHLLNVVDLFGLQAQCTVNPQVLKGVSIEGGDVFTQANSLGVDKGYNPADGSWLLAASRRQPNPAFSGSGVAFKLNYAVQTAASSPVTCAIMGVNSNGQELPLTIINGAFNSAPQPPTATPIPQQPPTATPIPQQPPTATPIPQQPPTATPPPTVPPVVPTATAQTPVLTTISGAVAYQNRPDNMGIVVQLRDANLSVLAEVVTGANGAFSFTDVPAGDYTLKAAAPFHLDWITPVTVDGTGQAVDLGSYTCLAGDTNDDGVVDLTDAGLIGANFGVQVPPAPNGANLNGDTTVDIRDLALLGGNFEQSGPQPNE